MKFYHLTPIKNVETILKEGLQTNKKPFASIDEETINRIYLTTSIKKLLSQEGEWNNNIAIIEVEYLGIIGNDMYVDWEQNYSNEESPFSFYTTENIGPRRIKYIGKILNGKILK